MTVRKNGKFSLRDPDTLGDHKWLVELHNDPTTLLHVTNPKPVTLMEHLVWWRDFIDNNPKEQRFIFCVDDVNVGFTKFYKIDRENRCCVLGADIHPNFRGQGYAKHMWALMLDHCFDTLDLHRVGLTTATYNKIGQKVYHRLGFFEEGRHVQSLYRDGEFHDEICMYMLRTDWLISLDDIDVELE